MNEAIDKVLKGNKQAYLEIVDAYSPTLRAYFASRVGDPATVDDLVQETFIAVYQALDRFDRSRNFNAWIRGVAHKRLMMYFRSLYAREKAMQSVRLEILDELSPALRAMESEDDGERIGILRRCINKLPERANAIVRERYYQRESVQDMARRRETTESGISSALYRIKQKLRQCIRQGLTT
jgi:RNA polymerase sigma-70 factor (ECF subfamily)